MEQRMIECVPNFSEGRDPAVIGQITEEIEKVPGVKLLEVDRGKDANRTVVTFAGMPEPVIEAAFRAIKKAAEVIDMRIQHGAHPRIGATDVCPLVPLSGITMEETVVYAKQLAKRVGEELHIPVYLYEQAAASPERKNLAVVRAGEYEGLGAKLKSPGWKPDFGPAELNTRAGAAIIGARDFLVAYNVNLDTTSVKTARSIAAEIREAGQLKKAYGRIIRDEAGTLLREPGLLKAVKAMGWFMEEYGIAQVSMNLTNLRVTPVHTAFDTCRECAERKGVHVTGSELVGLIPLQSLLAAGKYALGQQQRPSEVNDHILVAEAVRFLGLDELRPFDPRKKVIEYVMQGK